MVSEHVAVVGDRGQRWRTAKHTNGGGREWIGGSWNLPKPSTSRSPRRCMRSWREASKGDKHHHTWRIAQNHQRGSMGAAVNNGCSAMQRSDGEGLSVDVKSWDSAVRRNGA